MRRALILGALVLILGTGCPKAAGPGGDTAALIEVHQAGEEITVPWHAVLIHWDDWKRLTKRVKGYRTAIDRLKAEIAKVEGVE